MQEEEKWREKTNKERFEKLRPKTGTNGKNKGQEQGQMETN